MANISELLNFVRQDQDLSPIGLEAQDAFANTVQLTFRYTDYTPILFFHHVSDVPFFKFLNILKCKRI